MVTVLVVMSAIFSFTVSSYLVKAEGLDGYTAVDWTWNRELETTDDNFVIVGGDIVFWRYVDKTRPQNSAIWKSTYGDELSDEDVTAIWKGDFADRYIRAEIAVENISDENIRNYIYKYVNENVPDLKLKFDIDADIEDADNNNIKKAELMFNSDIGYRIYRDSNGICKLEFKFSPQFHLTETDPDNTKGWLPNMPHRPLPRAQYPYSSVLFSMWGSKAGSEEHYGALEVVEGNDPNYVYGQSFGYGDILEKGKIPSDMTYPNFEAGQVNQEGVWAGQVEDDTLDSNLIRIGQQYKKAGDLWYYSYGGAVGYNFKFPIKVTMAVDISPKVTKRIINSLTGEIITSNTDTFAFGESDKTEVTYTLADQSGYAIVGDSASQYMYDYFEIKRADTEELLGGDNTFTVNIELDTNIRHKILDVYVTPFPIESKLKVKYVDLSTGEELKAEEITGPVLTEPSSNAIIEYHITNIPGKIVTKYEIQDAGGQAEGGVNNPDTLDVQVPVMGSKPVKILVVYCSETGGGDPQPTNKPDEDTDPGTNPIDPPMCDSKTDTIKWEEKDRHYYYDSKGARHSSDYIYEYTAKLKIDRITVSPAELKSGYGFETDIETSISYELTGSRKTNSACPDRFDRNRSPRNEPEPPAKVVARLGWTTKTFGGVFIQNSFVNLEKVSSTNTSSCFSAPMNDVVGQKMIYTDIYLSGTGTEPRRHKIAFDIYGGGVNGTEWCTTAEKEITINGDMYEDAGTTPA